MWMLGRTVVGFTTYQLLLEDSGYLMTFESLSGIRARQWIYHRAGVGWVTPLFGPLHWGDLVRPQPSRSEQPFAWWMSFDHPPPLDAPPSWFPLSRYETF